MSKSKKTIPILKKERAEYEAALQNFYRKLGNKILSDASDPTTEKIVENDVLMRWQRLRDERALCSENILKIKNNEERLSELSKFQKEIEQTNKGNAKKAARLKPDFLLTIYKEFYSQCPTLFAPAKNDISEIEDKLSSIISELEKLEQDKKESKIFSKLMISSKIVSQKQKQKKLEKNIADILAEKITEPQTSEEITKLYEQGYLSGDAKKQFEELRQLHNYEDEAKKRSAMIGEEKDFVLKNLSELEADSKSAKKINELNTKIKQLDFNIDEILDSIAKNFVDRFYDEEGISLADENSDDLDRNAYSELLKKAASIRKKLAGVKYNILYFETMQKIQDEKIRILNAEKGIKNSKQTIQEMEEKINRLEESKKNSEDEVVQLQTEADNLKEKISIFTDENFQDENLTAENFIDTNSTETEEQD